MTNHLKLIVRRLLKYAFHLGRFGVFLFLLGLLTTETILPEKEIDLTLASLTAGHRFSWWGWEVAAIAEEAGWWWQDRISQTEATLIDDPAAKAVVLAFIDRQREIRRLTDQIQAAYAQQPVAAVPVPALPQLEADLLALRQTQDAVAPQVERILAWQVTDVLIQAGFGVRPQARSPDGLVVSGMPMPAAAVSSLGNLWPSVTFRFSEMPTYLIISERDHISQYRGMYLLPAMPAGARTRLEAQIEAHLDVSALVDNVGGIGSWPAMVANPVSLPSVLDTIAHEWTHNYLSFYPLGQHYGTNRDLTTMNETLASIVGGEISALVIERFYPDLVPVANAQATSPGILANLMRVDQPQPETYAQAMRRIRLHVDDYLAQGQIEAAEAYMEAERLKLVERGHNLRKLNQAYFAFHGSYAVGPSATDPIGPWLHQLRQQHPSLKSFVDYLAQMQSLDDLLAALDRESETP